MRHRRFMRTMAPCLLGALGSLLAAAAFAANTTVYRCLDAHLEVVYTDVPCKEGAPLEIRAGDADPVAVARLEKIRDALDQSAAQRISEERRLAAQRLVQIPRETAPEDTSGYGPYYTYPVGGYGYSPQQRPHRDRDRDGLQRRFASRGGAPPPPYIVPRP